MMATFNWLTLFYDGFEDVTIDGVVVRVTATFTGGWLNNNGLQSDDGIDGDTDSVVLTFSSAISGLAFSVGDINASSGWDDGVQLEATLDGAPVTSTIGGVTGAVPLYSAPNFSNEQQVAFIGGEFNSLTITNVNPNLSDPDTGWILLRNDVNFTGVVPCLTAGTLIETEKGPVVIEDLRAGDLVATRDRGFQPIRWIGSQDVPAAYLEVNEKLRPVRIKAGALSNNLPLRDLIVSRQHRMLAVSVISERMFANEEVLIPAIKMTELEDIAVEPVTGPVTYYHMLFDHHEIVYAEGAPTESLHTGPEAFKGLSPEAVLEILTLFPELGSGEHVRAPARMIPAGRQQREFVSRIAKNHKQFVATDA